MSVTMLTMNLDIQIVSHFTSVSTPSSLRLLLTTRKRNATNIDFLLTLCVRISMMMRMGTQNRNMIHEIFWLGSLTFDCMVFNLEYFTWYCNFSIVVCVLMLVRVTRVHSVQPTEFLGTWQPAKREEKDLKTKEICWKCSTWLWMSTHAHRAPNVWSGCCQNWVTFPFHQQTFAGKPIRDGKWKLFDEVNYITVAHWIQKEKYNRMYKIAFHDNAKKLW